MTGSRHDGRRPDELRTLEIVPDFLEQPHAALDGLPGALDVTVEANGLRQRLAFSAEQTSAAELIAAVVARVAVRDLFVVEPSIEDMVRTLYTG